MKRKSDTKFTEFAMAFSRRLAELGWTPEEAAGFLKISHSYIYKFLEGTSLPSVHIMHKLRGKLGKKVYTSWLKEFENKWREKFK